MPITNLWEHQFLLLEQGEYERVVQFGESYLQRPIDLSRPPTAEAVSEADVILTVALGYMGLGRERWQQKQVEQAAQDLQAGLDFLESEQLFPNIQAEIRTDLFKLRPYRILELLALPESEQTQREQGMKLLKDMLDQRGGIDGTADDFSGLDVDNFLRFVQQLRSKLTAVEQQMLFEQDAQNSSAISSYLKVYALVAQGFSEGNPALIHGANTLLTQLANRQDIYIEQAILFLLLGKPEAATNALKLSQDQDSLDFIHQYSGEDTDLIPGLYLYTERWLQQEVYPYFRDLANQTVSLEEYFNNPQIQQVLSQLSPEAVPVVKTKLETPDDAVPVLEEPMAAVQDQSSPTEGLTLPNLASPAPVLSRSPSAVANVNASDAERRQTPFPSQDYDSAISTGDSFNGSSHLSADLSSQDNELERRSSATPNRARRRSPLRSRAWLPWVGILLLIAGIGTLIWMVQRFGRQQPAQNPTPIVESTAPGNSSENSTEQANQEDSALDLLAADQTRSADAARQLVQTWQEIKSEAMGKTHNSSQLRQILAEPVLSEWVKSAEAGQSSDSYWEYDLDTLKVESVKPQGEDEVSVTAQVKEKAQLYENGKLQSDNSYVDNYRVQYDFIRQDKKWLIQDMQVLR